MKILVLNSGSSSIKYQLLDMPSGRELCKGRVEQISESSGLFVHEYIKNGSHEQHELREKIPGHQEALNLISNALVDDEIGVISSRSEVEAVGHRVVHGGNHFKRTTLVDREVKKQIDELSTLAPLHNPANLMGIEVAERIFDDAKQFAVFDTAFHSTIPEYAYRYAIPNDWYEKHDIRVYGFHGTSHQYVSRKAIDHLGEGQADKLISVHLGNGCSVSAIQNGKCIDTSMGFSPLQGLIMGTRSGDLDPSIIFFLQEQGLDIEEIKVGLNKKSGLKGICGLNDLRKITELYLKGDEKARLAMLMYTYKARKRIGAYAASLGGLDALVFTAGVGENASLVREMVCDKLGFLGVSIDADLNGKRIKAVREIQNGPTKVLIVPTNEELEIANQGYEILKEPELKTNSEEAAV